MVNNEVKMANRSLNKEELDHHNSEIKRIKDEIATREKYLHQLETEITEGVWEMSDDDFAQAIKEAHDSRIWMEQRGLLCATGKCNNQLGYECDDCKAKRLKRNIV